MNYSLPPKKKSKPIKYGNKPTYVPVEQVPMVAPSGRTFLVDETEVKMMKSIGWLDNNNTEKKEQ